MSIVSPDWAYSVLDQFYFLHYSKRLADILPKTAFASPQDAAAFRELITRQILSNALDPRPFGRRGRLLLLILIFLAIMMVVWTRTAFVPRKGGAPQPEVPAAQDR